MAVSPPDDQSPPLPPDQCQAQSQADTDEIQKAQPATQQEEEGKKRKWSRWRPGCWGFARRAPREGGKMKTFLQRFNMGRFGGLFKKSDKEKPAESNPYAQQPPAAQSQSQSSPPPQYDQYTQYNNSQYNDNRSISQPPLGQPSGLPTGPRPGGLPSRVAPGPNQGYGDDKSPPPQYSPYGRGSPSLSSTGGTPVLPSNTSSPSVSSGFPREKYGASDGVGRNRFEPAPSPYGNSGPSPPQGQGGYGNLDDSGSGGLFANYNGPAGQTTSPSFAQTQAPYDAPIPEEELQQMTEKERYEAGVQQTKAQIIHEIKGASDSGARSEAMIQQAVAQALGMTQQTFEQGRALKEAEKNAMAASLEIQKGKVNLIGLDKAQSMWNFKGNSKAAIRAREEKKMGYDRAHALEVEEMEQEEKESQLKIAQMHAGIEAQNQKALLGGSKASKHNFNFEEEEFEDDTGEQRFHNEKTREHQENIVQGLRQVKGLLKVQGEELDRHVHRIQRMADTTEQNNDRLWQNRVHLDTKYLKK